MTNSSNSLADIKQLSLIFDWPSYISFSRDTLVFVNGNLSHLILIVDKQHFNNLWVGRISMHYLGTFLTFSEPSFIIMVSERPKNIISVSVLITISFKLLRPQH